MDWLRRLPLRRKLMLIILATCAVVLLLACGLLTGMIYLQANLHGLYARPGLFAAIVGLVLLGSLAVTVVLSSRLQRSIFEPILQLTETARIIAERKDYSVRAARTGGNEVGVLTDAFNQVLTGIQERESALYTANEALRAEVTERKRADDRVQAQLTRLELMHRITRAIGERQDHKGIFQVLIGSLEDHLPIDFGCVCLYDEGKNVLTVASVGARSESLAAELSTGELAIVDVAENGLSQCVCGHLVYEPDVSRSEFPFHKRLTRSVLGSLVVAPLPVDGRVFGVLVTARRQPQGFDSAECEFLRQLSEHVALAAHQLQLHSSLQHAYDDLRHTQQAVVQQERLRALGQMASGVAHDINNALSPVSLYTESVLEHETGLTTRAREQLKTVQRAINDIARTVSRMREFYRQREVGIELSPVNANDLVQQVIDLSRARWSDMPQQRGIVIEMKIDPTAELPAIMAVESEILEALINLIFNAVDAMPEGGTLTLRTRVTDTPAGPGTSTTPRHVCIEVSDTGVGMNEDTRRRCIEPFFTTKGERGTGLGLAMVYGVVERHSSDMEIRSAVGNGTTVRLSFPVTDVLTSERAQSTGSFAVPTPLRILVVDDDPLVLQSLRDALENDGHHVTTASGGEAGIEVVRSAALRGEPFAVVITDLGMPYIDGRKVASAVKDASPATPVILLTGWGQRLIAEGDIPAHVDRVLNKPPKMRDLREALGKCLKSASFPDSTRRSA